MKKLKKLLYALMALGAVNSASALDVVVNVDDASRVTCQAGSGEYLQPEGNTFKFTCEEDDSYFFSCKESYEFVSIIDPDGDDCMYYPDEVFQKTFWTMGYTFGISEGTYTITTREAGNATEYTSKFTITMDDPSQVSASCGTRAIEPEEANVPYEFYFDPTTENVLNVHGKHGLQLHEVTLNNITQTPDEDGYYLINVTDGDDVKVYVNEPVEPTEVTVSFVFESNATKDILANLCVNDEPVADFNGTSFTVPVGSKISFEVAENWVIQYMYVNGSWSYFNSYYSGTVTEDTEYTIYGYYNDPNVTFNVNINDVSHLKGYLSVDGYYGEKVEQEIKVGDNTFVFPKGSYFYFETEEPYVFDISRITQYGKSPERTNTQEWYLPTSVYTTDNEFTYELFAYDPEEMRTATATITMDNVEKIHVTSPAYKNYLPIEVNVPYTLKFNPNTENTLTITPEYGFQIYKVTVDGVDKEPNTWGEYQVIISDGAQVNVQAAFPEGEGTVTFKYNTDGFGCIDPESVKIDGEKVENFDGYTFKAKYGSTISFSTMKHWNISTCYINDVPQYSPYSYVVRGDVEVSLYATYVDPTVLFNINIDDPTHVKVYNTTTYEVYDLVAGDNTLKGEVDQAIRVEAVEPYGISEIYNIAYDREERVGYDGSWTQYLYAGTNYNYRITTYDIEATRTASATVIVDDASMVIFERASDYKYIQLENGSNTIKFNPEKASDGQFSIRPTGKQPIWKVTLDGEEVSGQYGYQVTLTDGCTVEITAIIPDIDVTATFEITDEDAAANLITEVTVNGQPVEFNGKSVTMKAGQTIGLTLSNLYRVNTFEVNGSSPWFSGTSYSQEVMGDVTFTIDAYKLTTFVATIKVDDPENVIIGNGYGFDYDATIIKGLKAGENQVEFPATNGNICWKAGNRAEIVSVTINGADYVKDPYSWYGDNTSLTEGDVIEFTTAKASYDKTAIVWVDDKSAAIYNFGLQGNRFGDRTEIELEEGYNLVEFRDEMLPLELTINGETHVGKVYLNGEAVEGLYGQHNSFEVPLAQDDVLKIFITNEPVECNVTLTADEGVTVEATTDRIVPVADFAAPLTVFGGTEYAFTAICDDENIERLVVKNGDDELTLNEDGNYLVTINGDTEISVKKLTTDSIREISIDGNADVIYDLQGRRINKAGKGLYIINGQKVRL